MNHIKHNFAWEQDESNQVFWKYQKNIEEQSRVETHKMITLCNIEPTKCKILDVGCGLGYHSKEFASLGCDVVGIDVADFSVEHSKKITNELKCSIYKMRGKDVSWVEEFDLAIAIRHTLGFMEYDELETHIKNIWRSVKPRGYFILTVPYTLERGMQGMPVHKWSEEDGKFVLVDKYITKENMKVERCVIIDSTKDLIEEYYEIQKYYSWEEILDLLNKCGINDIISMKDFDGNLAQNGKEARIFIAQKNC